MISLDFHVHSCFSFDSRTRPEEVLLEAKRKGLNGLAITDHETILGALAIARLNQDPSFLVIAGAEYHTQAGDLMGLFLREEIATRDPAELLDEIHRQGGLTALPHPCHGHDLTAALMEKVDLVEVFNARETPENNRQALEVAQRWNKPMFCGSDAHFMRDIGTCRMIFDTWDIRAELLRNQCQSVTGYTPRYKMSLSQIIKAVKLHRYYALPYQTTRLVKRLLLGH